MSIAKHRRSRDSRKPVLVDSLEHRRLLAATWSDYAKLIGQDEAASTYANYTGAGQVVAVIDSGIDYNHPALGGGFGPGKKVIAGYDFVDNDADPMDPTSQGHGTNVAGMIAADRFEVDGVTYQGIAPDAKLIALRAGNGTFSAVALQKSFDWIVNNYKRYGITIVNMSLGGGGYTQAQSEKLFRDQTKRLNDLGIAVIAASGNSGEYQGDTVAWPAAEPSIFAIGSINKDDQVSSFSDRGALLDLLAPGEQIVTTSVGGDYEVTDGTSFASPLVAGVYALINGVTGGMSGNDVMSILRSSSNTQYDGDGEAGLITRRAYAQLDLPAAIKMAEQRAGAGTIDYFAGSRSAAFDAAYDTTGVLHVAYRDVETRRLMYTTRLTNGLWTSPVVVDKTSADVGQYASIAIDPTGKPAIAYYDSVNQDMRYASFSGSAWSNRSLDTKGSVGQYTSLAFASNGDPSIAYYRKTTGDLRLMTYVHADKAWTRRTIDSDGNVGQFASIATFRENTSRSLDRVSFYETLAIAYTDASNGDVMYWSQGTDSAGGSPYEMGSTVADLKGAANVALTLASDGDGKAVPYIAYQDTDNADVKFSYRDRGNWRQVNVATSGNVGTEVEAYVASNGRYHVVYFDKTKGLSYDATIGSDQRLSSVARIGTTGATAAVATSAGGVNVTLIGLNKSGKSFSAVDII